MKERKIDIDLVMSSLKQVTDPELRRSIVDLGMVEDVRLDKGRLNLRVKLTIPGCPLKARIAEDIKKALAEVPGLDGIEIKFSSMTAGERKALTSQMVGAGRSKLFDRKGVGHVVLVASGKGGVGKSTVAANLAVATAQQGLKVGLLDADIYGFSIPRLLGLQGRPTIIDDTIIPLEKYGVRVMSMGFFVDESKAVIWRGPMIHKAVSQFLSDVFWDGLDFLFVDSPPGTGDVTLSLSQIISGTSAIIVTTPQPGAYIVSSRIGEMARKTSINLLGVVENMSYFFAPGGKKEYIFGTGGGEEISQRLGIPLLGQIPLETRVRQAGDDGRPIVAGGHESLAARELRRVAEEIVSLLRPAENSRSSG